LLIPVGWLSSPATSVLFPATVDRVFPVVRSGWQLLIVAAGALVTACRLRRNTGGQ